MRKFLILLFIGVVFAGCKKNEIIKEPNFEEMKLIISKSEELNQVFMLYNELNNIREIAFFNRLNKSKSNLKIMSTVNPNSRGLKTESDLKTFFDEYCDNKGNEILSKIKMQLKLLNDFVEKNPTFNKFSLEQKRELLNGNFTLLNKNQELKNSLLITNNFNSQIKLNSCMGSFNIAFNSCHEVYNITSTGIWLTALFSGETLLGPAFIAQGIAMALEMQCQDTAATTLSDCKD